MDQELADAAAYAPSRGCACTHGIAWNNIMAAILKEWHQIENLTLSINAHLLEEHFVKFHHNPIWNDTALGFFWRGRPQQEEEQEQDE